MAKYGVYRLRTFARRVGLALLLATQLWYPANAALLRIGIQDKVPPFVMQDGQSGLIVDVLREAFATQQIQVSFVPLPNSRIALALQQRWIDVATATKPGDDPHAVYSRWPVLRFHNYAITLQRKIPKLNDVSDLAHFRVTAFRNASKVLDPAFSKAITGNPDYTESSAIPSAGLVLDRSDVIVSQADVFRYFLRHQLSADRYRDTDFAYNDILGSGNRYWFGFANASLRDSFEKGISTLYASGTMDRIIASYTQRYGTSRELFIELDCRFAAAKPGNCATAPDGK